MIPDSAFHHAVVHGDAEALRPDHAVKSLYHFDQLLTQRHVVVRTEYHLKYLGIIPYIFQYGGINLKLCFDALLGDDLSQLYQKIAVTIQNDKNLYTCTKEILKYRIAGLRMKKL